MRKSIFESQGQKITERPNNRPYDPKEDVLVNKKFEREAEVVSKRSKKFADEIKNDINKIFSDFSKGIELVEEYNNSVDDDFKINSIEIPFSDGAWYKDDDSTDFIPIEFKKIVWFEDDGEPSDDAIWYDYFELNDTYAMFSLADPYYEGWEFPCVNPWVYMDGGYIAEYGDTFDWNIAFQTSFDNPFGGGEYDCVVIPIRSYNNDDEHDLYETSVKKAMLTSVEEQFNNNYYANYRDDYYFNFFGDIKITLPNNDFGKTVVKTLNQGRSSDNNTFIYFDEDVYNNLKKIVNTCKKLEHKW